MEPCLSNLIVPDTSGLQENCSPDVSACDDFSQCDYATLAIVKLALGDRELTEVKLNYLQLLITQVSRMLDDDCHLDHGYFAPASQKATTKIFDGNGAGMIKLPPYVKGSVEQVLLNGYELSKSSFVFEKSSFNFRAHSHTGGCCRETLSCLGISSFSPSSLVFPSGSEICVKARWGFAGIQKDVELAVIDMVLQEFRRADPALAPLQSADGQAPSYERRPISWTSVWNRYRGVQQKNALLAAFGI